MRVPWPGGKESLQEQSVFVGLTSVSRAQSVSSSHDISVSLYSSFSVPSPSVFFLLLRTSAHSQSLYFRIPLVGLNQLHLVFPLMASLSAFSSYWSPPTFSGIS